MISKKDHKKEVEDRDDKIIHFGRNPIKGGTPARENNNRTIVEIIAGLMLLIDKLKDQCFVEVTHKIDIIEIVMKI